MSDQNSYCISCGEQIQSDENFCPECGASQNPEELDNTVQEPSTEDNSGFASWAIGFKPGSTGRNIAVGAAYLIFSGIGIPLLIYSYLRENPDKLGYAAWAMGIIFILAGLGAFSDGSARGIVAGTISLIIGVLFIPSVREKLPLSSPPGIDRDSTGRRKVLAGTGYAFIGLITVGAAAPETETNLDETSSSDAGGSETSSSNGDGSETSSSDAGGSETSSSNGDGSETSSSTDSQNEEAYPNAFYYDESTEIVLEDDVSTEADSIGSLYIRGTARNESSQDYSYVQLEFSIFDASGAKIADGLGNTSGLDSGQSWRYEAIAASADNADSYQIDNITAY